MKRAVRRKASGVRRPKANSVRLTPHALPRTERRRGRLIFVFGGASSGKSEAALTLAGQAGPRAFLATGQALDDEMLERIARHRVSRAADWQTVEVPVDLAGWFEKHGGAYKTVVLDCLTLWLSNLTGRGTSGRQVTEMTAELLRTIRADKARVVVVSNELGLGLVPAETTSRRFRDLAGSVNQQVAKAADEVYFVLSGIPLRIK